MAPTANSRRCSGMPAIEVEADGRQTRLAPPHLTHLRHGRPIFALMSRVKRRKRGSASSPTVCVGSYRGYDRAKVGAEP
jgi:hypothetical protein